MNKKEKLNKKLEILTKILENKDEAARILNEEQKKNNEIINPNFANRSTQNNSEPKLVK